ncbi:MAG: YtxH domain-containing protein [Thermodesulfovibrionales bacterium]|nr:YtxH domain-containing protein [Thermodesulfovibrionales bacterium]
MNNKEGSFGVGAILLSFLLGTMVGAGLALLVAPQSGIETRRKIKDFAGDVTDKASEYFEQAKVKATSSIDKGKEILESQKTAISAALEAGKEAYDREVHKH